MSPPVADPGTESPRWARDCMEWFEDLVSITRDGDETMDTRQRELSRRFDNVGWGLLFLLIGALALPSGTLEYASVAAVGALLLGLNVARRVAGVPVRWFSIILGTAVLVAGVGAMAGTKIDVFVLFFGLLGAVTVAGAIVRPGRSTAG
jgi:hypothetical protein